MNSVVAACGDGGSSFIPVKVKILGNAEACAVGVRLGRNAERGIREANMEPIASGMDARSRRPRGLVERPDGQWRFTPARSRAPSGSPLSPELARPSEIAAARRRAGGPAGRVGEG
jgi:hypothetical protein